MTAKQTDTHHATSAAPARTPEHAPAPHSPVDRILHLQRTAGNQAVQRLVRSGALQAKLAVSQPGDRYEQEADRVAEQVLRMPEPTMQAKPVSITPLVQRQVDEEEEDTLLQSKEVAGQTPDVSAPVETQINALRGGGQPLDPAARAYFEPRFGRDFSGVRVHTDAQAAESARAVNARAFTVGRDVVFGAGQYALDGVEGKKLLGHELTHVVQQRQLIKTDTPGYRGVMRQHKPVSRVSPSPSRSIRLDFYPGKPIDAGEVLLGLFASKREKSGKTAALKIESLDDIFFTIETLADEIRKYTNKKAIMPFISELHILGHGNPGEFKIGTYLYNAHDLKGLKAGRTQPYMKLNAIIYLEGCSVAAGSEGKQFMYQMGRVFFGGSSGSIWGNTCPVLGAVAEITTCQPVTYKYPDDFRAIR